MLTDTFARRALLAAATALILCSNLTSAHADPWAEDATGNPMFEMPDLVPNSHLGAELMVGTIDYPTSNLTVASVELSGYWPATSRLALHTLLPIAYATGETLSGTSLGNIAFGLGYVLSRDRWERGSRLWSVGADVWLPTASDGGDASSVAVAHGMYRVTRNGCYAPEVTTLGLHSDYRRDVDKFFFQGQFGFDFHIADDSDNTFALRLGLGGGVQVSRQVAFIAELTTISDIVDDSSGEDFLHVLDLGTRYWLDESSFGARFYLPLDNSTRNGLDILGFAIDYRANY